MNKFYIGSQKVLAECSRSALLIRTHSGALMTFQPAGACVDNYL